MAIARPGPIVAAVSGTLGSVECAQRGPAIIIRQAKCSTNKHTQAQLAARARISEPARAWDNLTENKRANWKLWASNNTLPNRLGVKRPITALAAFAHFYPFAQATAQGGVAYLRPPPGNITTPAPVFALAKATAPSTLTIQTYGDFPEDGTAFEQAQIAWNLGPTRALPSTWQNLGWIEKTDDESDWSAALSAAGIALIAGARFFCRVRWCWYTRWGSVWIPSLVAVVS